MTPSAFTLRAVREVFPGAVPFEAPAPYSDGFIIGGKYVTFTRRGGHWSDDYSPTAIRKLVSDVKAHMGATA